MKKQKTQSKIIVALTAVVILLVAISATLTFAYFTANNSSSSSDIQFGTLGFGNSDTPFSLNVTADTHTGSVAASLTNLEPGCTVGLAGTINLTGTIAAFVRMGLTVTYLGADGLAGGSDANADVTANGYAAVADADWNTAANFAQVIYNKIYNVVIANSGAANQVANATWLSGADGFIYLDRAATAGALIDFSNKTITFEADKIGNPWQGAKFTITINAQAIQAEHLTGVAANAVIVDSANPGEGNVSLATVKALGMWGSTTGLLPVTP